MPTQSIVPSRAPWATQVFQPINKASPADTDNKKNASNSIETSTESIEAVTVNMVLPSTQMESKQNCKAYLKKITQLSLYLFWLNEQL